MALSCGIIGLPNTGKSTIFEALTAINVDTGNYPFCTIEPNVGVVPLKDERLDRIADIVGQKKRVPTTVRFLDIAGLVKGASKGEGLGNQFLGHIRQVDAIIHVVRCFKDENVSHVEGQIDPVSDIEIVNLELVCADLEVVERRIENLERLMKSKDKSVSSRAKISKPILQELRSHLLEGKPVRSANLPEEDLEVIDDLNLLTLKKVLYVCNIDEANLNSRSGQLNDVIDFAKKESLEVIFLCGKLEAEISSLESNEDKSEFRESVGISGAGIEKLVRLTYRMLGLKTYYTIGDSEVRARTFKEGVGIKKAAGAVHTDFENYFTKARVYHCNDLFECNSESKIQQSGKQRIEGKNYQVQDGDVVYFLINK